MGYKDAVILYWDKFIYSIIGNIRPTDMEMIVQSCLVVLICSPDHKESNTQA